MTTYTRALKLYEKANFQPGIATTLSNMAVANVKMNQHQKARHQFRQAIQIYQKIGMTKEVQKTRRRMTDLKLSD